MTDTLNLEKKKMDDTTIDKRGFVVDLKLVWAAVAAVVYITYTGTNRLNAIESDITVLKATPAQIQKVASRQDAVDVTMKELQLSMTAMSKSNDDIVKDIKSLKSDLNSIGTQLTTLTNSIEADSRSRRRN
jgi:peptidoglycan hydrolase CwlO-like protein